MGRNYDIAERIMRRKEKPTITIDAEHTYKINNSKSAVLMLGAVQEDSEELELFDKIITLMLGEEAHKYIESQEYDIQTYQDIIKVIMAAISDEPFEEEETETEKK